MKANELRIGNWVDVVYADKVINAPREEVQVLEILMSGINSEYGDPMYCFDDMKPIPLTEEWLIKFGFEQLTKKSNGFKSGSYSYSGKVSLILNHDGLRTWTNFWQGNEMRYVHQLQNLYFALTREELTIKE